MKIPQPSLPREGRSHALSLTARRYMFLLLFPLWGLGGTSCSHQLAPSTVDPVFHCGHTDIDSTAYSIDPSTVNLDSLGDMRVMTRWFVVTPDYSTDYTDAVDANMAAVNAAFEGYITWERDSMIWYIDQDVLIQDLMSDDHLEGVLSRQYSEHGIVNVYVVPTGNNLLGYTRLFKSCTDCYEEFSPRYDNIFISIDGLLNQYNYVNGGFEPGEDVGLTVVHEFGHFTSLDHNFKDYKDFMSYHCYRDHFSELLKSVLFMATHRAYLLR